MPKSWARWTLLAVLTVALSAVVTFALNDFGGEPGAIDGATAAGTGPNEPQLKGRQTEKASGKLGRGLERKRQIEGPLPAVTEFPIVSSEVADANINEAEFVLGVVVGTAARAYPINMLSDPRRELLNDVLGGEPIALAWCDQCQCPRVFSRRVAGKTLTLSITGETLGSNMLLKDAETGSEWVELLGNSADGPFKGERFEAIPCVWTDWKTWRSKHPETTVLMLSRAVSSYRHAETYSEYPPERAYFARQQWGLDCGESARSWPFQQLALHNVVNDEACGKRIVIIFNPRSSTVTAFDRELGEGEVLTFHADGAKLVDDRSLSDWDPITGEAVSGPHRGERLRPVAGIVSMASHWLLFHPDTEIWKAPRG